MSPFLPKEIFRTYDIRGPVGERGLNSEVAYLIGRAIGSEARELSQNTIAVGRDGRLSSPELCDSLIRGLCESGLEVLFLGMVPTPLVYFATVEGNTRSGVMVTASHNPGDHNGFKIVLDGKTLTTERIQSLRVRALEKRFIEGEGRVISVNMLERYEQCLLGRIQLERSLKIIIDCGNGVAGEMVPRIYRKLGCDVVELFCEVDGHFPNHHPDPTVPENLKNLIEKVHETQADLGLAFDGDADRLGLVTDLGEIIWPDRQMMLFSIDVLSHIKGADIIFDVKCSRRLPEIIRKYGGNPVMWRTGHSLLKEKLFELEAPLAGEMSGHIFFRDEWYGFDDAIYAGGRLLQILSQDNRKVSAIFSSLPMSINTPELKVPMSENDKFPFMERLIGEGDFGNGTLTTIDGIRVDYPDGFGLVRPSNTSEYLIVRFESDTSEGLSRIEEIFRQQMLKINKHLQLPF